MPEKLRIKRVSTRWLVAFKIVVFIIYTLLATGLVYMFVADRKSYAMYFHLLIYAYWFYVLFRMLSKIRYVEFDDDFLYVARNKNELLIPLENIKSVDIKTLGGVYRVDLYYEDILGSYFYFKPSILYPLNYEQKDALVNLLRYRIDAAKKRRTALPLNVLTS